MNGESEEISPLNPLELFRVSEDHRCRLGVFLQDPRAEAILGTSASPESRFDAVTRSHPGQVRIVVTQK